MQDITIYQPAARMTLDQAILAWLDEKHADSVRNSRPIWTAKIVLTCKKMKKII